MSQIKALGYVRVSTEEQSREGVSLDAQREKIKAYCSLHDAELLTIEEDAGISGKAMGNRSGLQSCLNRLRAGEANALVILKLDRLSRSTKDVLELSDLFQKQGWALHSISEKLDTSSAAGRFVLTILAALAQMEREQIGERTSLALRHKMAQGEHIGAVPLGFEAVESEKGRVLLPLGAELEIVRRIESLREEGKTLRDIAAVLNAESVPTKRGGRWHQSTVRSIILSVIPRLQNAAFTF